MRILVTGKSGQVGSAIIRCFGRFGSVIGTDRKTLDLSRPHEVAGKLDRISPDVVINCAAYTEVDKAEDESEVAFLVNAAGPRAIAEWTSSHGIPLVHFSTDYVFDGSGQRPWHEDDAVCPLNVYGASKLAGENAIREIGGSFLIVRTQWVYAAHGNNFFRSMALGFGQREELRVVSDQFGSPTSADCVAAVLADVFRASIDHLPSAFASAGNMIHLAASGETNWYGFASAILDGMRRRGMSVVTKRLVPIPAKDYPTRAVRPYNCRLDLTRLKNEFQIVPPSWRIFLETELDRLAEDPVWRKS